MDGLAERIRKLSESFDPYEYADVHESDTEATAEIERMLSDGEQIDALIAFCDTVLESDDEECHQEAAEIKADLRRAYGL